MNKKHGLDKRIEKVCPTCKKNFLVSPYRDKTVRACSRKCLFSLLPSLISKAYDGKRSAWKNKNGYLYVHNPKEKKVVLQHRYVMEEFLGRKLNQNEAVHHKNHIRTDNNIENLEVFNRSEHAKMHCKERWASGNFYTCVTENL